MRTSSFIAGACLTWGGLALSACNSNEPVKPAPAQAEVQSAALVVEPPTPAASVPAATVPPVGDAPAAADQAPPLPAAASAAKGAPGAPVTAAGTPAAPPAAAAAKGEVASADTFATWLESDGGFTAGKPGQIRLTLQAKPPFHCNEQYPYKFVFAAPPAGVSYPSPTVRDMKVGAQTSTMVLPIQATAAGAATVKGTFSFSVCTDDKCLIEKRDLSLNIQIN